MPGRGLATAGSLILIALTCIAIAKRLERERRLIRRVREEGAVQLDQLSDDEALAILDRFAPPRDDRPEARATATPKASTPTVAHRS